MLNVLWFHNTARKTMTFSYKELLQSTIYLSSFVLVGLPCFFPGFFHPQLLVMLSILIGFIKSSGLKRSALCSLSLFSSKNMSCIWKFLNVLKFFISTLPRLWVNHKPSKRQNWQGYTLLFNLSYFSGFWNLVLYYFAIKTNGLDSPCGPIVRNIPANAGDMGLIPALGWFHMLQSN